MVAVAIGCHPARAGSAARFQCQLAFGSVALSIVLMAGSGQGCGQSRTKRTASPRYSRLPIGSTLIANRPA